MKERLREITVGSDPDLKSEIVEYNGEKFEVRQPTVATRSEILSKSGMSVTDAKGNEVNFGNAQIAAVIFCTYVPGTDDRVFEEEDVPMLRQQPAGSFVDKLSRVAMRLMNVDSEEEAKN